jgi:hypothetical protein
VEIIEDRTVASRKNYRCDGIEQILEWGNTEKEFGEKHTCKGITRGEKYYYQKQRDSGSILTYRSCLPCNEFIKKHELYVEY